jgi:ketosteroid isomerase-like protein
MFAMTSAENKKLMQEIFAAAGNPDPAVRDRALFVASLADDAKWVVTGQYSWSRTFTGKEVILGELHGHVRSLLVERARTIAHRFIADGDHVVVEAKGDNLTRTGGPLRQRLLSGVPAGEREDQGGQGILRLGADRKGAGAVS